jgi:hypothetical protein
LDLRNLASLNLSIRRQALAVLKYYPLFIALAAFVVAALLSERAISLMQPDAKAALVDASARTRLLNILVAAVFLGLILWRPIVGWGFLGAPTSASLAGQFFVCNT